MATTLRRHLLLPRRPAHERTGRLLLLALTADRTGGHPDNIAATARLLGATDNTVRSWRRSLLDDGLLVTAGGFLRLGPAWESYQAAAHREFAARRLRWGWDPLPRQLLGEHGPEVLHAAAVVHGDAVGPQDPRRFVRADAERAALAGVAIGTVRRARRALEAAGLVAVEQLRRGRATLLRARWKPGSTAGHGAPMGQARAARLAAPAAAARAAMSSFATRNEAAGPPQSPQSALRTPPQYATSDPP